MKKTSLLIAACVLYLVFAVQSKADIVVNLVENGAQIDVTLSGSADVSNFNGPNDFSWSNYSQNSAFILLAEGASQPVTRWDGNDVPGGFTGSNNTIGLLSFSATVTGSLVPVGILPNGVTGGSESGVYLPTGYAGGALSGSGSFTGSFASLGMVEGEEYFVTWQSNGLQTLRITTGAAVPEPATGGLIGLAAFGFCFVRRRRK